MLRVAAYCRVSTDQEDQANSFQSQQRYFQEYIQRNPDWTLVQIYADEGISGTSTKKRRQFHAMISAAREGKIDLIITKEVSRFARNTLDTLEYTRELRRRNVGVLFLLDQIDTRRQEGELRLTLMSSIAQEESRKTSERVKWGQKRRMEQGVVFGGSLLGYRVDHGTISVDPAGAQVVRRIFQKYLYQHKGSTVIARELQAEGVLSGRGNCSWTAATVLKILKNEKYCGDLIQKKTYTPDYLTHEKKYNHGQEELVVLRDHHEPLVSRAEWNAVQQERKRRSRGNGPNHDHGSRHWLSGKIRCGCCGSGFLARTKKTSSGDGYRVWRCGKATREGAAHIDPQGNPVGCGIARQLREEVALDLLRRSVASMELDWEQIIEHLSGIMNAILRTDGEVLDAKRKEIYEEQEKIQHKKQTIWESFLTGSVSLADASLLNRLCDAHMKELESQLMGLDVAAPAQQDFRPVIREILNGTGDSFYPLMLERMTVRPNGVVEVRLIHQKDPWVYRLAERGVPAVHDASTVPISVSNPFSSG